VPRRAPRAVTYRGRRAQSRALRLHSNNPSRLLGSAGAAAARAARRSHWRLHYWRAPLLCAPQGMSPLGQGARKGGGLHLPACPCCCWGWRGAGHGAAVQGAGRSRRSYDRRQCAQPGWSDGQVTDRSSRGGMCVTALTASDDAAPAACLRRSCARRHVWWRAAQPASRCLPPARCPPAHRRPLAPAAWALRCAAPRPGR
jgi:hypothetical protein